MLFGKSEYDNGALERIEKRHEEFNRLMKEHQERMDAIANDISKTRNEIRKSLDEQEEMLKALGL